MRSLILSSQCATNASLEARSLFANAPARGHSFEGRYSEAVGIRKQRQGNRRAPLGATAQDGTVATYLVRVRSDIVERCTAPPLFVLFARAYATLSSRQDFFDAWRRMRGSARNPSAS